MSLERGQHVGNGHLAAVMELHALADFERPYRRIGRRLPGFGKRGHRRPRFGMGFHQRIAPAAAGDEGDAGTVSGGIEHIGRSAAIQAKLQMSATLRLLCLGAASCEACGGGGENTKGCGSAEEFATVEAGICVEFGLPDRRHVGGSRSCSDPEMRPGSSGSVVANIHAR